jgi:hypothetical protein
MSRPANTGKYTAAKHGVIAEHRAEHAQISAKRFSYRAIRTYDIADVICELFTVTAF